MMRKLIISKNAEKDLIKIFEYLELKWSERVRKKFALKVKVATEHVLVNPESYPKSEMNSKFYKYVISKQVTLFYKFDNKNVRLLKFFDTRQNPNKIKE